MEEAEIPGKKAVIRLVQVQLEIDPTKPSSEMKSS